MDLRLLAYPLFALLLAAAVAADEISHAGGNGDNDECVYTIYVRTGSVIKGGTDARISLAVSDANGRGLEVSNLADWGGLDGPGHDHFERGELDAFSGRGPCGVSPPICRLNLTSNGAGAHHGWYCEYVEVTTTGPHVPCAQTVFYVQQWLADDAPPYRLYAIIDGCREVAAVSGGGVHRRFVVGGSGAGQDASV